MLENHLIENVKLICVFCVGYTGRNDAMQVDLVLTVAVAAGRRDVLPRDGLGNHQLVGLGSGMSATAVKVLYLFILRLIAVVTLTL